MTRIAMFLLPLLMACLQPGAQPKVQTVVPVQNIIVGNAFQVQYVVQELQNFNGLQTPDFGADFELVSGPRIYQGVVWVNGEKKNIQNFSYTLIPLHKGRLIVSGATALYKNDKVQSAVAFINVSEPGSRLAAGSLPAVISVSEKDLEKNLQTSLFVKTGVNKKECFVGEPVVATFTLYSKVPSSSEVIKNPGFYGFSVVDMLPVSEQQQAVQNMNGAIFSLHQLRKVQLYPMQAGKLLIDEMTVNNTVEVVDGATGETKEVEWVIASEPMAVTVKALPFKKDSSEFSGAVGNFSLQAKLAKNLLTQGEAGKLVVNISGSGNFLQIDAPAVSWPMGVEGFEPAMTERLQKEMVPVYGSRQYQYTFTTDSMGSYAILPFSFTFFNPASKTYQTLASDTLRFTVGPKKSLPAFFANRKLSAHTRNYGWLVAAVLFAVALAVFLFKIKNRKTFKSVSPQINGTDAVSYAVQVKGIDAALEDREQYRQLQQMIYAFLKSGHSGQNISKDDLSAAQQKAINGLKDILQECEAVRYYNAEPATPFTELQQQAVYLIQALEK